MRKTFIKWFMAGVFMISALTGCYIGHDHDDGGYYRYRDRDRGGWDHHDRDGWRHDRYRR